MIKANNPKLKSWIQVDPSNDFPLQNIPFGIFKTRVASPRAGTRIGDKVIDLQVLAEEGFFKDQNISDEFSKNTLNDFISLGKEKTREVRNRISDLFEEGNDELKENHEIKTKALYHAEEVEMLLPVHVGDYTDFYSSEEHARNVGTMFRDPENALLPNWKHIPVGYHGRASTIVASGKPIHRPKGQQRPDPEKPPVFGPCKLLDFELEMAFITHDGKPMSESITTEEADEYIFGMVIFNDWSARDMQKWEYVPLGPFLAKSFASSVSPWIVTLDALEPFRTNGPDQEPKVLPYLEYQGDKNFDIDLEVLLRPGTGDPVSVCKSNTKYLYWNVNQQLAHQTVNGCHVRSGDMYASGTISGPDKSSFGSMLELSWKGTNPLKMPDGTERKFLNDGDSVIMRAHAEKDGVRIGFGEVNTEILPAK